MLLRWIPIVALSLGFSSMALSETKSKAHDQQSAAIDTAFSMIADGKLDESIALLDPILVAYESRYDRKKASLSCAQNEMEKEISKKVAEEMKGPPVVVVDFDWCRALFAKGFALIDLKRSDEAEPFLRHAAEMALLDSQITAEYAEWHKNRGHWEQAHDWFTVAEAGANVASAEMSGTLLSRALRGQGFVLIETGYLDDAEKLFKRCLDINPDDKKALQELDYIAAIRAKKDNSEIEKGS